MTDRGTTEKVGSGFCYNGSLRIKRTGNGWPRVGRKSLPIRNEHIVQSVSPFARDKAR